ncbi:MAG TPA: hypothetical protein PLK80_08625 [bacterium]|nr:hypothetical protein [bacterium]HPI76788.1 hypothetical protein [bacterium]
MTDTERIIEGSGGGDYLVRSVSIVTLLFERGILNEIFESGRLTEEEVDVRAETLKKRFPGFGAGGLGNDGGETG